MTPNKFINRISLKELYEIDFIFICSLFAILVMGFVMVSSASVSVSDDLFGHPYHFMTRQLIYLVLAILVGVLVVNISTDTLQRWGVAMMLLSLFLLLLVLMPGIGKSVNGSQRWINLIVFNLQASEVAKVCMVVYMSGYLVRRADQVREQWSGFIIPLGLTFCFLVLLLLEPDFGASVVLLGTVMAMLFLGGARVYQFILVLFIACCALAVVAVSESYRMKRLMNFIDPWADPFNEGYQLSQALIAYGRGEWFGLGLGNSVQKLSYLPEAHTDFVFSIWVEETGMLGGIVLILLFAVLVSRIFRIGNKALSLSRPFAGYMCYGFSILIVAQVVINVGVNTGFLPTKGLTLPLISYGGSSLIITLCSLFIVARVNIENNRLDIEGVNEKRSKNIKDSNKVINE
ncbi:cell division protein FtsW [Marinomonas sp. MED121]|uniref:putative lipid II flippase FtsW n=1 Tax=Marinomonas sp. MED121 TaxID=314277 RepID=UPI0000690511|nr:putative lipid II flippase FtsW [Marinomonas sp. MED121]EAQ63374.1 cell division protein FtsW [Marinomonas sp. MED121]